MLRWCFFIALFSVALAYHEPLVSAGESGVEVTAGLVDEFIELYEPGLRLGDAEDLYGWRCGDEPVGYLFIARTGEEGPVNWEEYNRLKHAYMATDPRVGEELSPDQQEMRAALKSFRQFTVVFTDSGARLAYLGSVYQSVFRVEGTLDLGFGEFSNQIGYGVSQKESVRKRVGEEWIPILVYYYFPVFSMGDELYFGPYPPEMHAGDIVPFFDNQTLNYPDLVEFNER
ncbi:hypothetical protein KAU45_03460 [bacterium]|nr:hypothetical protein [bacterium]